MNLVPDFDHAACAPDLCPAPVSQTFATMPSATRLVLDIVSDVICPWCYVGKRRLDRATAVLASEFEVDVRWRAFQLNPGMPRGGMDRTDYYVRKFGSVARTEQLYANVVAHAVAEGLPFDVERLPRVPNTLDAHRLIWLAETFARQDAVVDGLFVAYFVAGRDLGDPAVLIDVGQAAGLLASEVASLLASERGRAEVNAQEASARALGIDGVPAFVLDGRYLFSGAQEPDTIVQMLRTLHAKRSAFATD